MQNAASAQQLKPLQPYWQRCTLSTYENKIQRELIQKQYKTPMNSSQIPMNDPTLAYICIIWIHTHTILKTKVRWYKRWWWYDPPQSTKAIKCISQKPHPISVMKTFNTIFHLNTFHFKYGNTVTLTEEKCYVWCTKRVTATVGNWLGLFGWGGGQRKYRYTKNYFSPRWYRTLSIPFLKSFPKVAFRWNNAISCLIWQLEDRKGIN